MAHPERGLFTLIRFISIDIFLIFPDLLLNIKTLVRVHFLTKMRIFFPVLFLPSPQIPEWYCILNRFDGRVEFNLHSNNTKNIYSTIMVIICCIYSTIMVIICCNFSHIALFHMKTRVCLKYFVHDCIWKQFFASKSP